MDPVLDAKAAGARAVSTIEGVARQTLADGVYVRLRTAITRGDLPDGTELKQAQLAAQLGVSRVPVREALRRLQAEQLVVGNPFQRFVVTRLPPDHVMDLLDLRELLEVFVLSKSPESPELPQRIEDAKRAAERVAAQPPTEQFLEADREFHRILNGSSLGAALIDDIRERIHRYVHSAWTREKSEILQNKRREEILREHEALINALASGDADRIRNVVQEHINGTRLLIQNSFMEPSQPQSRDDAATDVQASTALLPLGDALSGNSSRRPVKRGPKPS